MECYLATTLALSTLLLSLADTPATAAQIAWQRPKTITDESDLSTTGDLVHAGSWGSTDTVNVESGGQTIPFANLAASGTNSDTIQLTGLDFETTNDSFFDSSETSVDTDFETVLDGFVFKSGTGLGVKQATLFGLEVGTFYELQVLISDDRVGNQTVQLGDTQNESETAPTVGSLSPSAKLVDSPIFTGTFVADATTQDFFLFGSATNLRSLAAYQLRVPTSIPVFDPLPGDFNDDGQVDLADYTLWRDNLGTDFNLEGNGDELGASKGIVDAADYLLWKESFGNSRPNNIVPTTATVPEPTGLGCCLLALVALWGGRRGAHPARLGAHRPGLSR
ncbi:hypothetical protein [Aeoliella mucimassa]|nr:hypothetical protein [Aeoliella mucimassa]